MLFSEIIKGNYRVFSRQQEAERTKNIATIKYIENLAGIAGVNIGDWNAKELFGTGTGHKFIDDKNEINRIFFCEMDRRAAETPTAPENADNLIDDANLAMIKAAEARYVSRLVAEEYKKAEEHIKQAMGYYKEHENYVRRAGEYYSQARRLQGNGENSLERQVREIASNSFYRYLGMVDGRKIRFATRGDIQLSHRNPAAGIDITINFGKFMVVCDIENFRITVHPFENNHNVSGHPHPHVQGGGGVCWGTAANSVSAALAKCNFVEPMVLLSALLINYNPGSPYVSMERFQDAIGDPNDIMAKEDMIEARNARRALFAAADAAQLDYDRARFYEEVPVVATEPMVTPPVSEPVESPTVVAPTPDGIDVNLPGTPHTVRVTSTTAGGFQYTVIPSATTIPTIPSDDEITF